MNVQKVNFKSKYIFPTIKSAKTKNSINKVFISTAMILADKKRKWSCGYRKNGFVLYIIDKYDKNLEKIADFYNIIFTKK